MLMLKTELLWCWRQGPCSMVCHPLRTLRKSDNHNTTLTTTYDRTRLPQPSTCRFRPKTFQLHVRDGDKSDGNIGCDPQEALKPLKMYRVKIQLRDKSVAVYVNDEEVCSSAREDRAVYKKAIVYAADPCVHAFLFKISFSYPHSFFVEEVLHRVWPWSNADAKNKMHGTELIVFTTCNLAGGTNQPTP